MIAGPGDLSLTRRAGPLALSSRDFLAKAARLETGERMVAAVVPRIVQVCREMAGKA